MSSSASWLLRRESGPRDEAGLAVVGAAASLRAVTVAWAHVWRQRHRTEGTRSPATIWLRIPTSSPRTPSPSTPCPSRCGRGWRRWVGVAASGTRPDGLTSCSSRPTGPVPSASCPSCRISTSATASWTARRKRTARSRLRSWCRTVTSCSAHESTCPRDGPPATARPSTSRGRSSLRTQGDGRPGSCSKPDERHAVVGRRPLRPGHRACRLRHVPIYAPRRPDEGRADGCQGADG